jgi:DNA-binding CsgD family transcriptional regulator/PAS domain-containing protein
MGIQDESLLEIVGDIYDAALEPTLWAGVVDRLRQRMNASSMLMATVDVLPSQGGLLELSNLDRDAFARNQHTLYLDNPFLQAWEAKGAASGRLFRGSDLFTAEDLPRLSQTKYVTEWVIPQNLHRGLGTIVYENQPFLSPRTNLHLFRNRSMPRFDEEQEELLMQVMPHLQRSILIHWRINLMERRSRAVQEVLDRVTLGVVLLDHRGQVTMMNQAAEDLVRRNRGLRVVQGRVTSTLDEEAEPLRALIAEVVATGSGKEIHAGGTMKLHGPGDDDGSGLLLLATPLATQRVDAQWLGPSVCGALFVSEPDIKHPLSEELLREWFGLTPAESRVAVNLMNGLSTEEISDRLDVSRETVRVQTKAVFGKTGVNRRTELAKLLLTSPALLMSRKSDGPR